MSYTRYALYYLPDDPALADFGARWLGWDVVTGRSATQFDIPAISQATSSPSKYGFHGTLKPPFRLVEDQSVENLSTATAELATRLKKVTCAGLELKPLGSFLALTPVGTTDDLSELAAACVTELDPFRAPLTKAELDRRRKARLSPRHEELLARWGYPFVLDMFRFHLTLTGRLPRAKIDQWQTCLRQVMPELDGLFCMKSIALVGEREMDGRFELINRYPLAG